MNNCLFLAILLALCQAELVGTENQPSASSNPIVGSINIPCYVNNCASCPASPYVCEKCTDPTNCCSAHCSSCLGITCNACETGFTLEFNLCIPTDPCASISFACIQCSGGVCQNCIDGTYLNTTLNLCWFCPDTCLTCSSPTFCTSCPTQTYLQNGVCQPCSSPCLSCSSTTSNCTACFSGATLNNNKCVPCPSNCANCTATNSTATTCVNCASGFYLNTNTGVCSACPLECSLCTGPDNCQNCSYPGMFFNSTYKMCVVCVEGCQTCAGPTTCSSCVFNFYVSPVYGATKCVSCIQTNCIECVSSTQCAICTPGYILVSGQCVSCGAFVTSCLNCTINPVTLNETCNLCKVNYFLQDNQCLPCPAFCAQCTSQTACTFCFPGFMTTPQGQCVAASPNCLYNPNATHCEGCTIGTYYSNGQCLPCQPNCLNCINGACSACKAGYFLSSGSCLPCSINCITCSSANTCTSCPSGQYVGPNGNCRLCYFGCSNCMLNPLTNNVDCNQCAYGSYPGYTNSPLLVMQTCLQCSNSNCYSCTPIANGQTQCTMCFPGYALSAGNCV